MNDLSPSGPNTEAKSPKKRLLFLLKLAFSIAMLVVIFRKVLLRDGVAELTERLGNLSLGWVLAAILMQLIAIAFSTVRWQRLLLGQGILPTWRFLFGSILIARFWGAFTPGGFTGFGGWRIYDIHHHTGKTARATATIGVEMVLGQLAFGAVVMAGSLYGARFIGTEGVLIVNVAFLAIMIGGLLFLGHPRSFLFFTRWLPGGIRTRVQTLVDAVCAYQGKGLLLLQAALCGVGTHAFNNLIYVCAARALGVELGVGEVFFASSLQILATILPASINGIGLREAAAVALYTSPLVGLPMAVAVLIPTLGFACEMFVSAFGGLVFASRRAGYAPTIRVQDPDRERLAHEAIEEAPPAEQPRPWRGLTLGLGAGLLAGVILGLAEAAVIIASGGGRTGVLVLFFGAAAYGIFGAAFGAGLGWFTAVTGRFLRRGAMPERDAFARIAAFIVAFLSLAIGAFRVRRDLFHEELAWKSLQGLLVALVCVSVAVLIYLVLSGVLRAVMRGPVGGWFVRAWFPPVVLGTAVALIGVAVFSFQASAGPRGQTAPAVPTPSAHGNVLFIVVDTLRADHLPSYGYSSGSTPFIDAFAQDAIRFDQAFTNSSWTRPSFASLLTGRLPSSHGVMSKASALPDAVVTLPEALKTADYTTGAFATNYNVAPYFNFQQGFDEYQYLEPDFVLGADDASAKLLLLQFVRQRIEKRRASGGHVAPGTAYQDAETVNKAIFSWLDRTKTAPWFLFVGYMDPHDPYFVHPYSGNGYARAAHQRPEPGEAPALKKLYDGEITYWDAHFGRLLGELKQRGLYDDLTIVVTSDHGEEFYEHGGFWHGTTLYDEQVRVPLFVKLPQSRRGGTAVRHWVQSIDIMPTLLKQLGVDVPEGVQGGELFVGVNAIYAEESHEGNVLESVRERRGTDELKLITANRGNPRRLAPVELYRVDRDPAEQQNLAETEPDDLRVTTETLAALRKLAQEGAAQGSAVALDEDVAKRLKALGYIESDDESD